MHIDIESPAVANRLKCLHPWPIEICIEHLRLGIVVRRRLGKISNDRKEATDVAVVHKEPSGEGEQDGVVAAGCECEFEVDHQPEEAYAR
jgi:hypothetical protein